MNMHTPAEEQRKEARIALRDHTIFIAWKPEYELGVVIIDEQHRGIVAAINSLHFAMHHGVGGSMLPHVVEMVKEYAKIHFRMEEEYHEKCGFPDSKQHHALHLSLLEETFAAGKSSVEMHDPRIFLTFMKEWWIKHICGADMAFKKHLTAMR